ncbi:MAG: aminoacyltransferase [Bacilli bacterium]|nr:aminoacyltransferase [Bacilli bacterium]
MKIITLDEQQFDTFAKNHKYSNYYQTSSYGKTMKENGFNIHYLGLKDDSNQIIGASLIIYKEIFIGKKIAYAPRGILINYKDRPLLQEMAQKLKQVLGKQGFLILRMDPYILATIRNKNGKVINMNKDINDIMKNIKSASFKYKGQNKFFENELPRYEAICPLNEDLRIIFKNLSKRTRHKINRAVGCGITIFNDKEKNINKLYEFIKDKTQLSKKYIEDLIKNYETSNIYFAVLNTDSFVIEAKKRYEQELEKNDQLATKIQIIRQKIDTIKSKYLNAKMESDKLINTYKKDLVLATELLKKYPEGFIIGAALTIEHNDTSNFIIDGFDKKYSHLNCTYLIKWFIINEAKKKELKYVNFNAIVGEFKKQNPYKQLNELKLGLNTIPTEYIGEFELILNKFNYTLYKNFSKEKNYKLKNELTKKEEK